MLTRFAALCVHAHANTFEQLCSIPLVYTVYAIYTWLLRDRVATGKLYNIAIDYEDNSYSNVYKGFFRRRRKKREREREWKNDGDIMLKAIEATTCQKTSWKPYQSLFLSVVKISLPWTIPSFLSFLFFFFFFRCTSIRNLIFLLKCVSLFMNYVTLLCNV